MLTPRSLAFQNIGRFVTRQVIVFDEMGNLVQVDGENRNTGGSSGAGKSTVFQAIEYNLGLNDRPTTVLQSRLTKEGMYTEGVYDWDGKEVIIIRGKGKLSITINGEETTSSKLVEEKIDKVLGLDRDLFRKLLHKRQKEGGFFLNLGPAKTHEFLTEVLNLGEYRTKLEKVDNSIKELTSKKEKTDLDLKTARASLKASQEAILALGLAPIKDMHQAVIVELKTKADTSAAKLALVQAEHNTQNKVLEAQRPIHESPPSLVTPELIDEAFDGTALAHAENVRNDLTSYIQSALALEQERVSKVSAAIAARKIDLATLSNQVSLAVTAKTEATKIAEEIKKIRDCMCPTCEQQWVTDHAKHHETALLAKLYAFRTQIDAGATAEGEITKTNMEIGVLERELAPKDMPEVTEKRLRLIEIAKIISEERQKMDLHQANLTAKNKAVQDEYNRKYSDLLEQYNTNVKAKNVDFAMKQNSLRTQQNIELDQVRGQADVDRRALDAAVNKLRAFEESDRVYKNQLTTLKAQETKYNAQAEELSASLVETEKNLAIAEETKRAIKSFMSCSFDEALEEIGDTATRIIRAIPNMANATIQFQGVRETGNGKIKEEVNAVISMDGEEGIDLRSLSGGEGSSADLAIDLAVIDLIENRSNKGISIFILDEPFTGLDTVSIEMVLEVLKNAKINKKLIIVDHNPEVKQMVESRIVAVREGLTSEIVQ